MHDYETLDNFLVSYFYDEDYKNAIEMIRRDIAAATGLRQEWDRHVTTIRNRSLPSGEAYNLVSFSANRPLRDNTDDEAYIWLDMMVKNVERTDEAVEEYYK